MPRPRPPRRLPTPDEVLLAPQVAPLAVLRSAIDVLIVALTAAQPELWPTPDGRDAARTSASEAADEVIRSAQALARAVDTYGALVARPRVR